MINNKLGKTKESINEYNGSSGVSDTEMASIYDIPNITSDISDEKEDVNNKLIENKGTVRILNDNMASMYNMLKNN